MDKQQAQGHILALITMFIWGITFVTTKLLLEGCTPIEILIFRFLLGYAALWIIRPRLLRTGSVRAEATFALAGACGVTLYFFMENIALTMTTASNVGVIVATAPLFTALVSCLLLREGKLEVRFFVGFALAICGIALISFTGASTDATAAAGTAGDAGTAAAAGSLALLGCGLALVAAMVWAVYANVSKQFSEQGIDVVLATRRTFFWGLAFMIPCRPALGFHPNWNFVFEPTTIASLAFLGLGASALCYVMWNAAVKRLGAIRTSAYIYLTPVITIAASVIALGEPLTPAILVGAGLTIAGLVLSEWHPRKRQSAECCD